MKKLLCLTIVLTAAIPLLAGDWPDWRGPKRDGSSPEKNLPNTWSPKGENLLWKVPFGGISAPVVHKDRVYLFNTEGTGAKMKERLMAFDASTGKLVWEKKWAIFLSDVPPHRMAWSSPSVDPETGNVFAFGGHGQLWCFTRDGKEVWNRSLGEEFAWVTTHGGRTPAPVIDGDQVMISGVTTGWGAQSRAAHRFFAFDKRTGENIFVTTPGGRPYDTTYSPPMIAELGGQRLFIVGGGDGTVHAVKAQTGEPVWKFTMSKRGINTGVVVNGSTVYVSHSEENLDTSEMGLLAALDGTFKGEMGKAQIKWQSVGFQGGVSSPFIDGDRIIQVDNGANVFAFDLVTGRQIWKFNMGTIQKSTAVFADGKIYVGTENGKFFILKPHNDRCEKLSEVTFRQPAPGQETGEKVIGSAAVSDGRVFIVTNESLYAIGKKNVTPTVYPPAPKKGTGDPAYLQVVPAEIMAAPGQTVSLRARLFDAQGNFLREEKQVEWNAGTLKATAVNGNLTIDPASPSTTGIITAKVGSLTGQARARVIAALPWSWNFDDLKNKAVPPEWINCNTKFETRPEEGGNVLVKLADNPATKRARAFFGPVDMHDYTVEAQTRFAQKRRQMGDAGLVAQRYNLVLFGNQDKVELQSWQPETQRTTSAPFKATWDVWYKMKLRVESLGGTKVRAQGKVWAATDPEPANWTVERIDDDGNLIGAPGLYADAPFEVFFDNLKVTKN